MENTKTFFELGKTYKGYVKGEHYSIGTFTVTELTNCVHLIADGSKETFKCSFMSGYEGEYVIIGRIVVRSNKEVK